MRDLTQKQHALERNFPVVADPRYLLEAIGPELRQDIATLLYASSKLQNNSFGIGTDNDLEGKTGYPIIKQRTFSDIAAHGG